MCSGILSGIIKGGIRQKKKRERERQRDSVAENRGLQRKGKRGREKRIFSSSSKVREGVGRGARAKGGALLHYFVTSRKRGREEESEGLK